MKLTCIRGRALQLMTGAIVQVGLQQEVQDDVTQQLQAQEAAVPGLPLPPHRRCQGRQQVRQHCLVVRNNLVAVLAQSL